MTFLAGETLTAANLNTAMARGQLVDEVSRTTASGSFTAETVLDYITFTAISGASYRLLCSTSLQSSVAADLIDVRFRWQAAAALTTSGTEFHHVLVNADVVNKGQLCVTMREITGLTPGQISIGITAARNSGTGNISSFGSSSQTNVLHLIRSA